MSELKERVAGRELNACIAAEVMGWVWTMTVPHPDDEPPRDMRAFLTEPGYIESFANWHHKPFRLATLDDVRGEPSDNAAIPAYSTDIAAAFQVVEKMRGEGFWPALKYIVGWDGVEMWQAAFHQPPSIWDASDPSLPLAICKASLKAIATVSTPATPAVSSPAEHSKTL